MKWYSKATSMLENRKSIQKDFDRMMKYNRCEAVDVGTRLCGCTQ